MTNIGEAIELGTSVLTEIGQSVPRLDVQVLLGHVLHVDRATLIAHPEIHLTGEQEQQYQRLLERRKRGDPFAYIVGHKEFFGLDFFVDRRVLIPRPETELLVEIVLKIIRDLLASGLTPVVADIGTGSGVIPIALAVQEPRLPYVYATDISLDALTLRASIVNDTLLNIEYICCMATSLPHCQSLSMYLPLTYPMWVSMRWTCWPLTFVPTNRILP